MAYYSIEPFGEAIADQRHGIAVATLANVNRDAKRKPDSYKPADFIYWHPSHRKKTESVLHADPEKQSQAIKQMLLRASKQ
jgi:hypothetical protein